MKQIRRLCALAVCLCVCLSAFSCGQKYQKFERSRYDVFDTVTFLTAYAKSENEFLTKTQNAWQTLKKYHIALDAYNAYDGVKNLHYVNANAAAAPVKPEKELFELLKWLKSVQPQCGGRVNAALGAATELWKAASAASGAPPSREALSEASKHVDFDDVILDYDNETVYFRDPMLKLDVGAVGKGFAARAVSAALESEGIDSYILSIGGNITCGSAPKDGRDAWKVAVKSADPSKTDGEFLYLTNTSCATSGDYYRAYEYNGQTYSHIIDPETLSPADAVASVTAIHSDPAVADLLSTALFIAGEDEGRPLAESFGAETVWQEISE